jgi:predicted Rossmann fold nucleotide-binding protein DprA/Smf involved in DNA uptake
MFHRIVAEGGAYLTLAEARTQPLKFAFFRRNEALMALSHAAVLGECPLKSGAVNAMKHASKLSLPRFVLPFGFAEEGSRGSWVEVDSRSARLLFDEQQVLKSLSKQALGDGSRPAEESLRTHKTEFSVLAPLPMPAGEQGQVVVAVAEGATTVDRICIATGLEPAAVQYQILLLTLSGHLQEDASGLLRYQSVK